MSVGDLRHQAAHGVERERHAGDAQEYRRKAKDQVEHATEHRNAGEGAAHLRPNDHVGNHEDAQPQREHVARVCALASDEPHPRGNERHHQRNGKRQERHSHDANDHKVYLLGNGMTLERKRLQEDHLDGNDGRPHGNEERKPVPKAALLVRVEVPEPELPHSGKTGGDKGKGFHGGSYPARDITFIAVTTIPVASSNALVRRELA